MEEKIDKNLEVNDTNKETKKAKKKFDGLSLIIVLLVICIVIITGLQLRISYLEKNNNLTMVNTDLRGTIKELDFDVEIPKYIKNRVDALGDYGVNIKNFMGSMLQVNTEDFVMKAAPFVDENADIMGLYGESKTDLEFFAKGDSRVSYIRYRADYEDYPRSIFINWNTDDVAYGLMLSERENVDLDKAFEILELDKNDYDSKPREKEKNIFEVKEYTIGNKFTVELPNFSSLIQELSSDGTTSIYMNKKLIMVWLYSDYDIDKDEFKGQNEIKVKTDIVLKYPSVNPFNKGTAEYEEFKLFTEEIDSIVKSVKYVDDDIKE